MKFVSRLQTHAPGSMMSSWQNDACVQVNLPGTQRYHVMVFKSSNLDLCLYFSSCPGYVYVLFESEKAVKALLQSCTHDMSGRGEYYYKITSRRMRSKEVQSFPPPYSPPPPSIHTCHSGPSIKFFSTTDTWHILPHYMHSFHCMRIVHYM